MDIVVCDFEGDRVAIINEMSFHQSERRYPSSTGATQNAKVRVSCTVVQKGVWLKFLSLQIQTCFLTLKAHKCLPLHGAQNISLEEFGSILARIRQVKG